MNERGNLIVTRRDGETIVIDGNVRVTLLQSRRGQARIAVSAPRKMSVDREEIWERKQQEGAVQGGGEHV